MKWEWRADNIALIFSICSAIAVGVWQMSAIRSTLEDGIAAEAKIREEQTQNIAKRLDGIQTDIRELRNVVMTSVTNPKYR